MKIGVESGLWTTGNVERALPLVTVLEVSGAVMSWTVDEQRAPQIEFTDAARADWLWRVVGERGHVAVAAVTEGPTDSAVAIELDGIDVDTEAVEIPRRLALGHWLRRWWPAGVGDGITALDLPLLDAEIAILTSAAEIFFTDDTIDSGVAELLSPHAAALTEHVRSGDPRVVEMVRRCVDLVEEVGIGDPVHRSEWAELSALTAHMDALDTPPSGRQDDYALAAGTGSAPRSDAIAAGTDTIRWGGVPAGIFDAAEDTVDWYVRADPAAAVIVAAAVVPGANPAGIDVSVRADGVSGSAVLGSDGRASVPLVDTDGEPMDDDRAWSHDWSSTSVTVGVSVEETRETRDRVRVFARRRLDQPGPDAFLAEILAAEADY